MHFKIAQAFVSLIQCNRCYNRRYNQTARIVVTKLRLCDFDQGNTARHKATFPVPPNKPGHGIDRDCTPGKISRHPK